MANETEDGNVGGKAPASQDARLTPPPWRGPVRVLNRRDGWGEVVDAEDRLIATCVLRQDADAIAARLNAPERPALFRRGQYALSGGGSSTWKIECDALTDEEWSVLAAMAVERLPRFHAVVSPGGAGDRFAAALRALASPDPDARTLIADDVLTTGRSMEAVRMGDPNAIGVVAFARTPAPEWVTPLFVLSPVGARAARLNAAPAVSEPIAEQAEAAASLERPPDLDTCPSHGYVEPCPLHIDRTVSYRFDAEKGWTAGGWVATPDHTAALATKDAEIARLTERLVGHAQMISTMAQDRNEAKAARDGALAECERLRADLARVTAERDAYRDSVRVLRRELENTTAERNAWRNAIWDRR